MSTSTLKTEEVPLSNQCKPKMESKPRAVLGGKAHAYEKLCSTICDGNTSKRSFGLALLYQPHPPCQCLRRPPHLHPASSSLTNPATPALRSLYFLPLLYTTPSPPTTTPPPSTSLLLYTTPFYPSAVHPRHIPAAPRFPVTPAHCTHSAAAMPHNVPPRIMRLFTPLIAPLFTPLIAPRITPAATRSGSSRTACSSPRRRLDRTGSLSHAHGRTRRRNPHSE